MNAPLIVFDTNCVLCSGMVAFVLAHERKSELYFVGAWSEAGLALAAKHHFSKDDLDKTFLVITNDIALTKSDAGIKLLGYLKAPWSWLRFIRIFPHSLRDAIYSFVAQRRYRWFGQSENCTVVPPSQHHRFIGVRARS